MFFLMPVKKGDREKIILGIDPGTRILGFGVVRLSDGKAEFVDMGVVNLKNEKDHFLILKRIMREVTAIIEKYLPDELAIEAPFYGKNAQVMLKLGRAQGVAVSAALLKDIPVFEYPPRSVKIAITGRGEASKEQVASIVQNLLKIDFPQEYLDATDALAIAMCHYFNQMSPIPRKSRKNSWSDYIKNHPEKVKN